MKQISGLKKIIQTPFQLGAKAVYQYARYQLGLHSGYFQLRTHTPDLKKITAQLSEEPAVLLDIPSQKDLTRVLGSSRTVLLKEADELIDGNIRLFEGFQTSLDLSPHSPLMHWNQLERGKYTVDEDIKFIWEPARFVWAFTLARAYQLTKEEHYFDAFKQYFEIFQRENPAYLGANWTSGQEVALRIIALCFAYQVFSNSVTFTKDFSQTIKTSVAVHAERIPPTLCYARAQRNNHLLSEALGLYTAGVFLQGYPLANQWRKLGWNTYNRAILDQISTDGTYIQHSTNYHRLMLATAVWISAIAQKQGKHLPQTTLDRLALSTQYLYDMVDVNSGQVPNLGHQDGSNILPLAVGKHSDFRPILQTASRCFLRKEAFPSGPWDEQSLWLALPVQKEQLKPPRSDSRINVSRGWASMRAIQYHARPAHADQLHVEIWRDGQNLALDAGTFQYNAQPPWQNALRTTQVHNTVTVDGCDQMTPASRFLWLDWANAKIITASPISLTASHTGYNKLGVTHQRTLTSTGENNWEIIDLLTSTSRIGVPHDFHLHWLLPDLHFKFHNAVLAFQDPHFTLSFSTDHDQLARILLIRAGEIISGHANLDPQLFGWFSPTYGVKEPALSILYLVESNLPTTMTTCWDFSD